LLIVTPGGTYSYGHRRSQIRTPSASFLSYKHCFFPYFAFCLPSYTRLTTLDAGHSSVLYRSSIKPYTRTCTFNDNDVLPTTISQRPSQLSKSLPPDANALTTRHIILLRLTPSIHIITILEHIGEACTQGHRHLRQRNDPPQPIVDVKFTPQGEPLRGSRTTEAQRSCTPVLLLWSRREGTATSEQKCGV
jgi:hypothetical protein